MTVTPPPFDVVGELLQGWGKACCWWGDDGGKSVFTVASGGGTDDRPAYLRCVVPALLAVVLEH